MRARSVSRLSGRWVDQALSRLFTQDLSVDEAEPLIDELRPMAASLAPSLVTLLNSPDRKTRSTASALLSTFADPASVPLLQEVLRSTGASDEAKLSAYSVLQTLGETLDPVQFLRTLRDPEALFAHGIEDLLELIRQDGELAQLGELLHSMPPEGLVDLMAEVAARRDPGTLKLFTLALWSPHRAVVAAAIGQLRTLRDARAVDPLLDLAALTRDAVLAEGARGAAVELRVWTSAGRGGDLPDAPHPATCHASFVDGAGAQMLLVQGEGKPGRAVTLLLHDERGVDDCFGCTADGESGLQELMGGAEARGLGWVPVGLDYCRARLASARALNARRHRRLPWAFELWRDLFGGDCRPDEAPVALSCRGVDLPSVARDLPRTAELFRLPEFSSWVLSDADLAPFLPVLLGKDPGGRTRRGAGRAPRRDWPDEETVSACLRLAATRRARARWRARLLANGLLWERGGDPETASLCRTAAAGMEERTGVAPEEHPFLRRMARLSFAEALGGLR
jgi:hypothetical protein